MCLMSVVCPRTATARGKAEQADYAAVHAKEDSADARACAGTFAPDFQQTGTRGGRGGGGGQIPINKTQSLINTTSRYEKAGENEPVNENNF